MTAAPCLRFVHGTVTGGGLRCWACGGSRADHATRKPAPEDIPAGYTDHTMPDSGQIRVYNHGGIDILNDKGQWQSVTTSFEASYALADLIKAMERPYYDAAGRCPHGVRRPHACTECES